MERKNLVILFTADPRKDAERAAMALSIATAAQVSDSQVSIFFALDGVYAAVRDGLRGLVAPEFAALEEMMSILQEEGAKFYVCHPFLAPRNLKMEDLREGIHLSSATSLADQGTNASVITI